MKALTLKRYPSGKWCACFSYNVESQLKEKPFDGAGVDLGLNSFAVLSDGASIENPRYYREPEKRLARLQRGLSGKKRGSQNWVKAKVKVARLHERIQGRRSDFLHKASRKIADAYVTVYVEDLKVSSMVRTTA